MKKQLKQFVRTINLLICSMVFVVICTTVFTSIGTIDMNKVKSDISRGK